MIAEIGKNRGYLSIGRDKEGCEIWVGISHAPLWSQYGSYLINLTHGHLSVSVT